MNPVAFSVESQMWSEWKASRTGKDAPLLPDFSYAGYRHGEVPLPKVAGPVFRVGDFGAKPDDTVNDADAIQKTIDACARAGGGVVLFEKGTYRINENDEGTNSLLFVTNSRIVLRGVGPGADGTILYSPKALRPIDPKQMYTGRSPIWIGARKTIGSNHGVASPARMNDHTLVLAPGHGFLAGDRVALRISRTPEQAASWIAPNVWDPRYSKGIRLEEVHEVTAVQGNVLTLKDPLYAPIREPGGWSVQKVEYISNVGVEGLRFKGEAPDDFVHHRSWFDDSAFRGIKVEGVEHSYLRDCHFENMNWSLQLNLCRQVTLRNLTLSGPGTHFGVQVCKSTGVLGDRIVDLAGHWHGPSLENSSCGTVYLHCQWLSNGSLDSHASNPYGNLYDSCAGGLEVCTHNGGDPTFFLHHLHALVLWNHRVTATPRYPVNFWYDGKSGPTRYPLTFAQVLAAGLHGESPNLSGDGGLERNESMGSPVSPSSLYLAQLTERLGRIPEDLSTDRPAWIEPPRKSTTATDMMKPFDGAGRAPADVAPFTPTPDAVDAFRWLTEGGRSFLRLEKESPSYALLDLRLDAPEAKGQYVLSGKARGRTTVPGKDKWNVARIAVILMDGDKSATQAVFEIPATQAEWKSFSLTVKAQKHDKVRVAFGLLSCAGVLDVAELKLQALK